MSPSKHTLARFLMSALLSLYLAISCLVGSSEPAADFGGALEIGRADAGASVGMVGATLNAVAAWAWGPWLRWLLVLTPWAWMPFVAPKRKQKKSEDGRRWGRWLSVGIAVIALCGSLAHPALSRLGVPSRMGGALGNLVQSIVSGPLGSVGSFLVLTAIWVFLLIHFLPPIRLELAFLDRWQERLGEFASRWFAGLETAGRVIGAALIAAMGWLRELVGQLRWPSLGRDDELPPMDAVGSDADRTASALGGVRIGFDGGRGSPDAPPPAWSAGGRSSVHAVDSRGRSGARAGELHDEQDYDDARDFEAASYEEGVSAAPIHEKPEDRAAFQNADRAGDEAQGEFQLSRDPSELLRIEKLARRKERRRRGTVPLPGLDLLDDVVKEERGFSREVLEMNARLLLETLSSFGVEGRINEIRPGPVITTFEFEPGAGVKVSQITSRSDDLALAMRAIRIRIVAPIPGKAAVGIEVPNPYPQMVTLKEVVGPLMAAEGVTPLSIALGKDTEGNPISADLAEMPHLLVAGATGSGKSVCLNSLICSLLLRNGPDQLRLLMIDPKMLELSLYNGIPHLMHPVITDHKEALKALKIMVVEMTTRYHLLARHGVRNVLDFNLKVKAGQVKDASGQRVEEIMPYIVVIVDELADLMMLLGSELETPVARLAQMARAVGIHLVLATQRPSVNVITGVIKANFPSRIGFRVISKVDSRTILDVMGAEQLLGKGDSLFLMAGMTQPTRIHGAFLSTDECEAISEHWQQYAEEESRLPLQESSEAGSALDLGEDNLLNDARRIVILAGQGSTSMLQRKLRVGYTRAARLMDMLEEIGVVGPFEGSKAREVLVKPEELEAEG